MTGSFDYTANDLINPIGANNLASLAMYYQRSLYEEKIYPTSSAVPIDLYYNKQLYGKVDPKQHTIITSPSNLSPIENTTTPHLMAVGPVALAFDKFVAHMRKANIMGVAGDAGNPKLYDIKAHHAFVSPVRQYKAFLEGLWKVYYNNFTPEQNEKIIDFASFVADYRKYMMELVKTYPVTQTNFLLTPSVSPFTTGLAIGIDNGDCGDDNYKYVNYLSDPNYDFYTKAAKKFGFVVDRNAPWILWADIYSPAFYTNLEFYYEEGSPMPVTRDTFFQAFYTRTWKTDLQLLEDAFVEAYRTLVHHQPFTETFPSQLVGRGITSYVEGCDLKPVLRMRPAASDAQRAAILTDKFLLDFYVDLRHNEAATPEARKAEVRHRAYEYYRAALDSSLTPLENAVKYVDEVYSRYVYTVENFLTAFPNLVRMVQDEKNKKQGYI